MNCINSIYFYVIFIFIINCDTNVRRNSLSFTLNISSSVIWNQSFKKDGINVEKEYEYLVVCHNEDEEKKWKIAINIKPFKENIK
jgi:hypothetical protein